jgi:hypothetical protein
MQHCERLVNPIRTPSGTAMIACRILLLITVCTWLCAADWAWAEGEDAVAATPSGHPGVQLGAAWGRSEIMSGGKVLHITLDEKAAAETAAEGFTFSYDLRGAGNGRRELWARIGYEWARAPLRWRIAGRTWNDLSSSAPTTDVMPIQTWNELGWIRLGEVDAAGDAVRVEINWPRTTRTEKDAERVNRILGILDCLCLAAPGVFHPCGAWKPGQDHRGEAERAAAAQVFALPETAGSDRQAVDLSGAWEMASWDEDVHSPADRLGPVAALPDPATLRWFALQVPGDRNAQRPEDSFHHRFILRTRVQVPASQTGRSFHLDIQRFNTIATIFVNGRMCAWSKDHSTAWQADITAGIRPGQLNDIAVVMKDRYYSLNMQQDDLGWRRCWNIPNEFLSTNQGTASHHELPVAADPQAGLTEPIALVAAGPVYVADAFVKTSVAGRRIAVEVTLHNPGAQARTVSVSCAAMPWLADGSAGAVAKHLPAVEVALSAGGSSTIELADTWADPQLWWPDDVHLYRLETTVSADGKAIDASYTRFGFREWTWDSHVFRLNGVKWQSWADTDNNFDPRKLVAARPRTGCNMLRLWANGGLAGMTRRQVLDYCDENGVLVRESGTFDGQVANYGGGLTETVAIDGKPVRRAKQILFANWTSQLAAWVRASRNHPSIFIWSAENEVTYINSLNLGQAAFVEPAIRDAIRTGVLTIDPTRPAMVDGGNALADESLPVNGGHYTEFYNCTWRDLPDAAYTRDHWYDAANKSRDAWRFVPDRPIMMGEVFFAEGYGTERLATIGGERCFIGTGETRAARGLLGRIFSEGWRWSEVASWHFWLGGGGYDYRNAWQPVTVLCRQWNTTFGPGEQVDRTLKVFNNTSSGSPITVTWQCEIGGTQQAGGSRDFALHPGVDQEWQVGFTVPSLGAPATGSFIISAKRDGREVFRDIRDIRVLVPAQVAKPLLIAAELAVCDPKGTVIAHLTQRGIPFTAIATPDAIPPGTKVLVIGSDAIPAERSSDPLWYARAVAGLRVLVLDQRHPLRYRALPADLEPLDAEPSVWERMQAISAGRAPELRGRYAFAEDLSHPAFAGLCQADLFAWGGDHVVYRQPYRKGTRGYRSLAQCEEGLACTALAECQTGDGLLLLSQFAIGGKLADNAVAQQLFDQLLDYAAAYVPVRRPLVAAVASDSPIANLLDAVGVRHTLVADPLAALAGDGIAVVEATPSNLRILATHADPVRAWCATGNWLMLWGVTPEGLADFNALVRWNHVLRPFDTERVLLSVPSDPLAAGLTLRDVVLNTGQNMYPWMALKRPDRDQFSYIVDHTDIAPFCAFPSPTAMGKSSDTDPGADHWPRNMVNGFTSDDNWSFCYTILLDRGQAKTWTLHLPKEEELSALRIRPSRIYHPITRMNLYVDDDPTPIPVELRADPTTQEVMLPPRRAKTVTCEVAAWAERGDANIVVIDNLWLLVKRPDDYLRRVKPLLNIGGLVRYDEGRGGILLNQLKLPEHEVNPVNAGKKQAIVKTVLGNLGAIFAGAQTVVAGDQLAYVPLRIPDARFNAYAVRGKQPAWLSGPGDFAGLPVGDQTFARVRFWLSDFSTSPVPSVFMLRGQGSAVQESEIGGIEVKRQADAVFFLHTAVRGRSIDDWERRVRDARKRGTALPEAPIMLTYRVQYEDGESIEVPVRWGSDIADWAMRDPAALPNASLAWTAPLPDAKHGEATALWMMQWTNPRPAMAIASIDLLAGNEKLGAVAICAITTATITH